jgi:hypothetical protein
MKVQFLDNKMQICSNAKDSKMQQTPQQLNLILCQDSRHAIMAKSPTVRGQGIIMIIHGRFPT